MAMRPVRLVFEPTGTLTTVVVQYTIITWMLAACSGP